MWQRKSERWHFYVLGSSGGRATQRQTMCLYLPDRTLIDAGNIFTLGRERLLQIDHIILTHSHLDHLVDIPFLIDLVFSLRERSINIYGLPQTIESLRKNIMNWDIWPEFGSIKLSLTGEFAINYVEVFPEEEFQVDGYRVLPVMSNHTVPTMSLIVKKNRRGFVYTSDTYRNPRLWQLIEEDKEIKLVLVDVSFPSYLSSLASASLHNTPKTLEEDLELVKRKDLRVYAVHIKPSYEEEVIKELKSLGRPVKPILGRRRLAV